MNINIDKKIIIDRCKDNGSYGAASAAGTMVGNTLANYDRMETDQVIKTFTIGTAVNVMATKLPGAAAAVGSALAIGGFALNSYYIMTSE